MLVLERTNCEAASRKEFGARVTRVRQTGAIDACVHFGHIVQPELWQGSRIGRAVSSVIPESGRA